VVSLVFILGLIPFTYFVCLVFNNDTLAQVLTLIIHLVVGAFLPDLVIFAQSFGATVVWGDRLRWGLCLIPTFPLIHGLSIGNPDILKNLYDARMRMKEDVIAQDDLWDWWNLKGDIAILLLHFVFWSLIIGWFELDLCQCWSKISCQKVPKQVDIQHDSDVLVEEKRVAELVANADKSTDEEDQVLKKNSAVRIHNFRKAYTKLCGKPLVAVEKVSFGLEYGECFALLGVNGAGKTTTFKSLTRDVTPTEGELSIAGFNV
jgi:ABC-type multidrug transport system fused ATPase/permease subunit